MVTYPVARLGNEARFEPDGSGFRRGAQAEPTPYDASVAKLLWARWHRDLGETAMAVLGPAGIVASGSEADSEAEPEIAQ
jgi:Acyl-CoA dehydrogenase, C-terminal domain